MNEFNPFDIGYNALMMLSDDELLRRLRNGEDSFVERKTFGDSKDWLKTVVAFANSLPPDYTGVLFIGVRDDGTFDSNSTNLDTVQRTLNKKLENAYPAVPLSQRVLTDGDQQCLAVVVPGSNRGPHFAGPSYVRKGSETVVASEQAFDDLIAVRNSKAYMILQWKDKQITRHLKRTDARSIANLGLYVSSEPMTVVECNQHFTILKKSAFEEYSHPLDRVTISWDVENKRLALEVSRG